MDNKSVTQQMFEDFLSGVSQSLEEEARAEFPGAANCYRVLNDFGHYCLVGFAAPGAFPDFPTLENEGVTAVLFHGIDSTAREISLLRYRSATRYLRLRRLAATRRNKS